MNAAPPNTEPLRDTDAWPDAIAFDGRTIAYARLPTTRGVLLVLKGTRGILGCGYLDIHAADRLGEALAIVRGVRNADDMLAAPVQAVSRAAADLGITPGMPGRDALRRLA